MKICHLISSLQYGGAERQFINILNNSDDIEKYAVFIAKDQPKGLLHLLNKDIKVCSINLRIRYLPYYILKIAFFLKANKIDVLQTHMYWANLCGAIAAKIAGTPLIITTEHGKNTWKKKYHRLIEQFLITPLVDKRICVSKDILRLRRYADLIRKDKLLVIPNGVNYPVGLNKIYEFSEPIKIGAIGRLIEAKDFQTLLKTCSLLREKKKNFHLFIIGDGPLREDLERLQVKYGLQEFVTFTGFQDNINDWLIDFDLFVMSSIREGQPLVLLEAMAYGLPIVATNVGGIPDTIVDKKEGLLVDSGDPKALCAAICEMIENPVLRSNCGVNARNRLQTEFSIENCCQRLLDMYSNLLESKKI